MSDMPHFIPLSVGSVADLYIRTSLCGVTLFDLVMHKSPLNTHIITRLTRFELNSWCKDSYVAITTTRISKYGSYIYKALIKNTQEAVFAVRFSQFDIEHTSSTPLKLSYKIKSG